MASKSKKKPIATTGQPGVPYATGGHPQAASVTGGGSSTTTKRHGPDPLRKAGLGGAQVRYWRDKMPGASAKQILKARAAQLYRHNPQAFGPNTNLTPIQLKQQVSANAQLQYGDQLNQIGVAQSQVDPVYNAYAASIAASSAAAQQAAQQASGAITQNATNLEQAQNVARAQLLSQMQAEAAKTGGTVDNSLFANDLAAAGSRQQLANTSANLATQLGANQQGFLAGQAALGEGARVQRKTDLQNQRAQLAGQIGAFKVKDRADILQAERNYGATLAGLDIQQKNANTSAKIAGSTVSNNTAKANKTKADLAFFNKFGYYPPTGDPNKMSPSEKIDAAKLKFFNKHGYFPPTGNPKKKGPGAQDRYSAGERSASRRQIKDVNNAVSTIKSLMADPRYKKNTHNIRQYMTQPKSKDYPMGGYDHDIVNAAFDLFSFGHLSQHNYNVLKSEGVLIPKQWAPPGVR